MTAYDIFCLALSYLDFAQNEIGIMIGFHKFWSHNEVDSKSYQRSEYTKTYKKDQRRSAAVDA